MDELMNGSDQRNEDVLHPMFRCVVRDDVHTEGGGAHGAVVHYSVRGHGGNDVIELLEPSGQVIGALTFEDVIALKSA